MSETFEARWVPPGTFYVRPVRSGWVKARGTFRNDEQGARAAVARAFGLGTSKAARIEIVPEEVGP